MSPSTHQDLRTLRRADFPYFVAHQTRWSDNDGHAHLNNSVFYHLMDSIFTRWSMENGIDPKASPLIGVVVSSWCQILGPLSFPDVLDVGLRVTRLGKTSVTSQVAVFKAGQDNPSIVGGITQVAVDQETKQKVHELNEESRAIFSKLLAGEGTSSRRAGTKL